MADKFLAEVLVQSKRDAATSRVELCVADEKGNHHILSLGPDACEGIREALRILPPDTAAKKRLTKFPDTIAVGRGRHDSVVLVRFEDDPAYGLTSAQAAELAEALLEEAETAADIQHTIRH